MISEALGGSEGSPMPCPLAEEARFKCCFLFHRGGTAVAGLGGKFLLTGLKCRVPLRSL